MRRLITTKEINETLLKENRGITIVGPYTTNRTPALFQCKCGHEWAVTPQSIRTGRGCPSCAIVASRIPKIAKNEIDELLLKDGRGITLVGEYLGVKVSAKFQCEHGHQWTTQPYHVINGSGCPHCSGTHSPTTEEFRDWLSQDGRGIFLVGEYTNNHTKTTFKCRCGHQWATRPNSIKNGTGCPMCVERVGGFNPTKPAWVYVLIFANFIKYGITNDLDRRLREHSRNGTYELAYSHLHESGKTALDWENNIKRVYGGKYATKDQCPNGWTETLPRHLLESIIN